MTNADRFSIRSSAALLFAATLCGAGQASAAKRDPARAEQMFAIGKQALDSGKLDEAAKAFAASQEADPSVGALLNLALVHEKMGKTATAWGEYKAAASLAAQTGQADREHGAKELAGKLEPMLSRLAVDVADKKTPVVVTVDSQELPEVSYGVPLPVDPGTHEVEATASGFETWSTSIEVKAGGEQRKLLVPHLHKGDHRRGQMIAGAVVGGVGVLGLIGGIAAGVSAIKLKGQASDQCDADKVCRGDAETTRQQLVRTANISTALFVAGGLLTVTGVVVFLTAPKAAAAEPATTGSVWLAPSLGGLNLGGEF